jgi:hypothetical protein
MIDSVVSHQANKTLRRFAIHTRRGLDRIIIRIIKLIDYRTIDRGATSTIEGRIGTILFGFQRRLPKSIR